MGKQAKPKPITQKGRNDNRPNGKAWKQKWGTNPPVEKSIADSRAALERKKLHKKSIGQKKRSK